MLKPTGDKILIEPTPAETITKSGLIIPDIAKTKPNMGTVLAVGAGVQTIKVGDKILHHRAAGTPIQHDGKDVIIMSEGDVYGFF